MMQCPNCKKENVDAVKFCIHCGKEIPKCPTCGKVIPVKMRFCPFDGVRIPENVLSLLPQEGTSAKEPVADAQETIVIPAVADAPKQIEQTPARAMPFGNISYCGRCGKAFETDGNKLCAACRNPAQPGQRPPQQPPMRPMPPRQPMPQGQPRPIPPRQPMSQRPVYRQAPPPVQKKSSRGLVITLVILLLLALLAVAALVLKFVVFDDDKDTDRKDRTSHSTTEPTERETETPMSSEEPSIPEEPTEPPMEETVPETTERPTVPPEERYDDEGNERLLYFIDHCTEEYFSESYFDGFDERTACVARNAIFARSGRTFDTPWLYEYFSRFDWYEPIYGGDVFHNGMLNTYQQANLELIMAYEAEMGY